MNTSTDQIADFVVLFITLAALGIGLLSSAIGWLARQFAARPRRTRQRSAPQVQPVTVNFDASPPAPLPAGVWLQRLNHQPDQLPHLLIVGPTGSGKTTFAVALLADRPGQIVALTPKLKPDDWRGLAAISLAGDGSYAPLAAAVAALEAERTRRCVALAAGQPLPPLTVVLDELPDLVDEVAGTGDLLRKLSQMGRDLRMRVIALATSELVEDLGLKGRGHARRNFATVRLLPALAGQPRGGTLQWGETAQPLALHETPLLARRAALAARQWLLPLPAVAAQEAEIDFSGREGFQAAETRFSAAESATAISEMSFSDLEIAQIAARIARGEKKSKVVQAMPRYSGPKYAAYSTYYERLQRAITEGVG